MLYVLNIYRDICQLFLHKTEKMKPKLMKTSTKISMHSTDY